MPLTPLAIWLPLPAVNPDVVLRNMLYVTPLVVLAVQLRLIPELETAVAVKFVGGFGGVGPVLTTNVTEVELSMFAYAPPTVTV